MGHPSPLTIQLSAPGKVILFGEYSVVFKKPAIAATLSLRTKLHLQKTNSDIVRLDFTALKLNKTFAVKDILECFHNPTTNVNLEFLSGVLESLSKKTQDLSNLTDAQNAALIAFLNCFGQHLIPFGGFDLQIESELPVGSGVGSSASFSVVLSAAAFLYEEFGSGKKVSDCLERNENGIKLSENLVNKISELAFSCEKIFHGSPSGVDHNTILRGSLLKFVRSDDNNNKMTFIDTDAIKILLVNTNVPRSTKKLVAEVKKLKENHPEIIECVLNGMESVAESAVKDLLAFKNNQEQIKDLENHFGELMSLNHNLLRVLGTSHPKLEHIVSTAHKYNLKAKLTGGGGGGFGFIYLPSNVENSIINSIQKELTDDGFTVYNVSLGGPGLIIHELSF